MTEQGLYSDLPMEFYISDPCPEPSLSKGTIHRLVSQSPAHARYHHPRLNPDAPMKDTSRGDLGTAVHSMILGGKDIVFASEEFQDWRKKEIQIWRDRTRAAGQTPLLAKQRAPIQSAADAALAFLKAQRFDIESAQTEGTMIWKKGETWKRGRFDLWFPDRSFMIDVKTCESADPGAWIRKSLIGGGYDIQAEHYLEGIRALGEGKDSTDFLFLLVEIEPPHCCSLVGLGPAFTDLARRKIKLGAKIWRECMKSSEWPGYNPLPHWADAPMWALADIEEREAIRSTAAKGTAV